MPAAYRPHPIQTAPPNTLLDGRFLELGGETGKQALILFNPRPQRLEITGRQETAIQLQISTDERARILRAEKNRRDNACVQHAFKRIFDVILRSASVVEVLHLIHKQQLRPKALNASHHAALQKKLIPGRRMRIAELITDGCKELLERRRALKIHLQHRNRC